MAEATGYEKIMTNLAGKNRIMTDDFIDLGIKNHVPGWAGGWMDGCKKQL